MARTISKDQVNIVMLGAFNPTIFTPAWLALNGMISKEQADNAASINIIHSQIAQFTAAYMTFDILPERFLVGCDGIYSDVVKDLVLKAFGETLPHTTVWQLGINRSYEFKCPSESIRTKFGRRLAPLDPWGAWGTQIKKTMEVSRIHGGVNHIQMLQIPRPDNFNGHVQVDLRPNRRDETGVFVDINNHFDVVPPSEAVGNEKVLDTLKATWSDCQILSQQILEDLLETVDAL